MQHPERCLIRLFKLYNSKCPTGRPNDAFYLRPLSRPKEDVWYQRSPVGHNWLANVIPRMFKEAGLSGRFTNHSLRATSATRLFDAGLDEQLIMSRTGHSSTSGVRSYKRVTDQLREKTSTILNTRDELKSESPIQPLKAITHGTVVTTSSDQKENTEPVQPLKAGTIVTTSSENTEPVKANAPSISFSGAANFTVNFHF